MDDIKRRQIAKAAAKKRKEKAGGKMSKDADFEKMFGKDIDEFLEDSEWDIESMDKMSQFSRGSKGTIRSAAQAGKLRNLEKLYLQRIETQGAKNNLQMTGGAIAGANQTTSMQKGKTGQKAKAKPQFREFQDRFQDDPAYLARGQEDTGSQLSRGRAADDAARRKAWDAASRNSSNQNKSVSRIFNANK